MLLPGAASSSVTAVGEWGPWINGGAWLTVDGRRVDLLYRDLGKVRAVIEACHAGQVERVYQPGHPHAFVSSIYMGEVALCRVLWDPDTVLGPLKRQCDPYPAALREALIRTFFWEATLCARERPARPRPRGSGLCRRLRLPLGRLPLPEPVRAQSAPVS